MLLTTTKALTAAIIFYLLSFTGLLDPVAAVSQRVSAPLEYGLYRLGVVVSDELSFWVNLRHLRQETAAVRGQLRELRAKTVELEELRRENQALRDQLGLSAVAVKTLPRLAVVVGRGLAEATLVVAGGANQGVAEGDPVLWGRSLVGRVGQVEANRSLVNTLWQPNFKVLAYDASQPGRANGVVEGRFGLTVLFDGVAPEEALAVGDEIVSSAQEAGVPGGLLLGTVVSIEGSPEAVFKRAVLDPGWELNEIEKVVILVTAVD